MNQKRYGLVAAYLCSRYAPHCLIPNCHLSNVIFIRAKIMVLNFYLVQIIFMDHLEFPESSLSVHHIDYSLPRASHVSDADFKFVMKHDKSRLSLNSHSYGARPVSDAPSLFTCPSHMYVDHDSALFCSSVLST
jgi:hypothetical protein